MVVIRQIDFMLRRIANFFFTQLQTILYMLILEVMKHTANTVKVLSISL